MVSRNHAFDFWLTYDGDKVRVTGEVTPYQPAVMHLRNGDPGYPEEGGEVEDLIIRDEAGFELEDADGKIGESLIDEILERVSEQMADAQLDAEDHAYDLRHDR